MLNLKLIEQKLVIPEIDKVHGIAQFVHIKKVPDSLGKAKAFVMDMGYENNFDPYNTGLGTSTEKEYFGVVTALRFVYKSKGNEELLLVRQAIRTGLLWKKPFAEYSPIGPAGGGQLAIIDKVLYYRDIFVTSHLLMEEV